MIVTRETDYALRILRALRDGERYSISEITEKELIPKQFAYKILQKLTKANLIEATRGAKGGCKLSTDLSRINLYDLIGIIDNKRNTLIQCMDPDFDCPYREDNDGCNVHRKLAVIESGIDKELRSHTLAELILD